MLSRKHGENAYADGYVNMISVRGHLSILCRKTANELGQHTMNEHTYELLKPFTNALCERAVLESARKVIPKEDYRKYHQALADAGMAKKEDMLNNWLSVPGAMSAFKCAPVQSPPAAESHAVQQEAESHAVQQEAESHAVQQEAESHAVQQE